ncbi:MAG: GyrI-like domain-containing protein [Fusobacteriaceae bacterium]
MKHEWRKNEKEVYLPKQNPTLINIPSYNYFIIKGKGNPNSEEFSERIGVLYSLSYAIKMSPKKGIVPDGYFEYTVYPLEAIWDKTENVKSDETLNKDKLMYTMMIRQPDFVTEKFALQTIESVKKNKPHILLEDVSFVKINEGLSVQMLHVGSYDDEPISFKMMSDFCDTNNLKRSVDTHREIYISDPRKVSPSKLKTTLRYNVHHNK